MNEKAPQKQNHFESLAELAHDSEHLLKSPEQAKRDVIKREKALVKDLEKARNEIKETVRSERQVDPLKQLEKAENDSRAPTSTHINRELKQVTLRRELTQIRRRLSTPQRALSKVIHQPAVRVVSEVSGKTVSRPSGMLGGGVLAFAGSTGYLLLAKNQGFRYNYAIFLVLFLGGFLLGLALELIVWAALAPMRRRAHD